MQSATSRKHLQQRHRHNKHRNKQFRGAPNRHPHRQSQTYQWQRHQQHTADEHTCKSQQQQNGMWQVTLQKAVQQSNHGRDSNRRQHRDRKQHKNPTSPDLECRRLPSQQTWRQGQSSLQRRPTRSRNREDPLEPWVTNTEGLKPEQTTEGMKQEIRPMKAQQVYTEVSYNTLTQEQRNKIIKSRRVLRQKGDTVRARTVAKGYTEDVKHNDDIYASTPIFCALRLLLTMSLSNTWIVRAGDISTAFLHAKAATDDLFMFPPTKSYNPEDQVVWKLNKAIYGLRSSPRAWQKHLAERLQQLDMHTLASEPNVFKTTAGNAFVLCYVDDLLFLGEPTAANKLFTDIHQHVLLRPTGGLTVRNTVNFLGRNIANKGGRYEINLADNYPTQQNCSTTQAWLTASQHQHREQKSATQSKNKHSTLRNTQHTDEQLSW